MLKLGVNIDHVATLREARYKGRSHGEPDPVEAALVCVDAGAHGITAHLREDRRHMLDRDISRLRQVLKCRFNLEMANVREIVDIALKTGPDIVCIVPEKREEVTTEGGLDVVDQLDQLKPTVKELKSNGIEVSLFVDPDPEQIEASSEAGSDFIELHTGAYAEHFQDRIKREHELDRLIACSEQAVKLGLRVNAGHGLNYQNVKDLLRVPNMEELNIGHSMISRAVMTGLAAAVKEMIALMEGYRE